MLTETETKKQNQNILKQNSFINILFTYVFEQKQQNRTIALAIVHIRAKSVLYTFHDDFY